MVWKSSGLNDSNSILWSRFLFDFVGVLVYVSLCRDKLVCYVASALAAQTVPSQSHEFCVSVQNPILLKGHTRPLTLIKYNREVRLLLVIAMCLMCSFAGRPAIFNGQRS